MASNKPFLPGLDDQAGPAEPITEARARELVDSVLDAGGLSRPGVRGVRRVPRAAWVLAAALASAAAAAATVTFRQASVQRETPPPPPVASELAPLVEPAPAANAPAPPEVSLPSTPSSPSDLLGQANELRAARRWPEATRTYERVILENISPSATYTAEVAAADLRLDHLADPRGALRLYNLAVRNGPGPLGEQAYWGIARASRALGNARAEKAALDRYVARYPQGLFLVEAQERARALAQGGN
ncbi:MAG TPA: hypothetical protein VGI39_31840 [Polyangiaceae bacterium]